MTSPHAKRFQDLPLCIQDATDDLTRHVSTDFVPLILSFLPPLTTYDAKATNRQTLSPLSITVKPQPLADTPDGTLQIEMQPIFKCDSQACNCLPHAVTITAPLPSPAHPNRRVSLCCRHVDFTHASMVKFSMNPSGDPPFFSLTRASFELYTKQHGTLRGVVPDKTTLARAQRIKYAMEITPRTELLAKDWIVRSLTGVDGAFKDLHEDHPPLTPNLYVQATPDACYCLRLCEVELKKYGTVARRSNTDRLTTSMDVEAFGDFPSLGLCVLRGPTPFPLPALLFRHFGDMYVVNLTDWYSI